MILPHRLDADEAFSPTRRAIVLTRALAYDTAIAQRAGSSFVLAVLFKKGNAASEKAADEWMKAFKPLESVKIAGLPFRTVVAPFGGLPGLEALVEKEGLDALFLCESLDADVASIKQATTKRKVLTLGTLETHIQAGVSVAVVVDGGKLQIVINLPQSRAEGASFGSDLLRIARVVK